jgi:hypothetical protein
VSNRFCSPTFRGLTSVITQMFAFAFGIPFGINTFYRYSKNSNILYLTLRLMVFYSLYKLYYLIFKIKLLNPSTHTLSH